MDNNFDQEQFQLQENLENIANIPTLTLTNNQNSIEDQQDQKIQIQAEQTNSQLKTYQSSFQDDSKSCQVSKGGAELGVLSQSINISQINEEQDESGQSSIPISGITQDQEQVQEFKQQLDVQIQDSIQQLQQLSEQMKGTYYSPFNPNILKVISQQANIFANLTLMCQQTILNDQAQGEGNLGIKELEENAINLSYELIKFDKDETHTNSNLKNIFQNNNEIEDFEIDILKELKQIQSDSENKNLDQLDQLQRELLTFRRTQSIYSKNSDSFDGKEIKLDQIQLQPDTFQVEHQENSSQKMFQSIQLAINSNKLDFKLIQQQDYNHLSLDQKIEIMKDWLDFALQSQLSLYQFQEQFKKFTDYFYFDEKQNNFMEQESCHRQQIKFVESLYSYQAIFDQTNFEENQFNLEESTILYQYTTTLNYHEQPSYEQFNENAILDSTNFNEKQYNIEESVILYQYTTNY